MLVLCKLNLLLSILLQSHVFSFTGNSWLEGTEQPPDVFGPCSSFLLLSPSPPLRIQVGGYQSQIFCLITNSFVQTQRGSTPFRHTRNPTSLQTCWESQPCSDIRLLSCRPLLDTPYPSAARTDFISGFIHKRNKSKQFFNFSKLFMAYEKQYQCQMLRNLSNKIQLKTGLNK